MRFPRLLALAAAGIAAVSLAAQQQPLTCPAPASGRGCELFHYHVAAYRPDTKQHVEISATPQFATQSACERAREAKVAANEKVVQFFRTMKQQQYEADRFGPCHCDMTTDATRNTQLRLAEEIRLRVRERLLDMKLMTDHEVIRALDVDPPTTPLLGAPKLVALPPSGPVQIVTAPDDLRPTKTIDTTKPTVAALDLPLVDPLAPPAPAPPPPAAAEPVVAEATPAQSAETPPPAEVTAPPAPAPEPQITETLVEVAPPVVTQEPPAQTQTAPADEEETQSAEEIAARFIEYETQRINAVLQAAANISDPDLNTRIYQACIQRIHLLSNLRLLIEGAGTRSRLANAAKDAYASEEKRLALIAKLFGGDIAQHWAPTDAKDVVFDVEESVANSPEKVLRDSNFSAAQKKQALYLVLAETEPTEDARLWLSTVIEGFLR